MWIYTEEGTLRKKNEDLQNRKRIQEESNADIFISIHLSFHNPVILVPRLLSS